MVWGGPGPVSGILAMGLYPITKIEMSTKVFATSVSVSQNVQKKTGESTHSISSTRLMQMVMQLLLAADGMS